MISAEIVADEKLDVEEGQFLDIDDIPLD